MNVQRHNGRRFNQLRPLSVHYDLFSNALASVLYELGNTKVLTAVTLQPKVPSFLRGTKTGWLTAQYAMLPTSGQHRIERETEGKRNGRFVEISRIIGRSLRVAIDLSVLGERTLLIDCDVLLADGGTRTACITAAFLALQRAQERLLALGSIERPFIKHEIGAISVGILQGVPVLDPDYHEDSQGDGDFNFVCTKSGDIIEVQGTSEKEPIDWSMMESMRALAVEGIQEIISRHFTISNTTLGHRLALTEKEY